MSKSVSRQKINPESNDHGASPQDSPPEGWPVISGLGNSSAAVASHQVGFLKECFHYVHDQCQMPHGFQDVQYTPMPTM